jgi:prepilin-type N-terminal cleavage/methylation domain-containing protein
MKRRSQAGFSLIELAVVMSAATLLAACVLAFLNSHFAMLRAAIPYRFLAQQAPVIGLLLTKTMGNADDYRIYASRADAVSKTNATTSGKAIHLWMRQPDGTSFREAVISFETIGGQPGLYFFLQDPTTSTFPAAPSWQLAGGDLTNVNFFNVSANTNGILQATLFGNNNDWITYAAEKK